MTLKETTEINFKVDSERWGNREKSHLILEVFPYRKKKGQKGYL